MKPLNDKHLKELLNRKLNEPEPMESDHLWEGIENALPAASSSNVLTSLTKVISTVGIFSIAFFADNKVATNPVLAEELNSKNLKIENQPINQTEEALLPAQELDSDNKSELLMNQNQQIIEEQFTPVEPKISSLKAITHSPPSLLLETTSTSDEDYVEATTRINEKKGYRLLTSLPTEVQLVKINLPELSPIELDERDRVRGTSYWSFAPYLSYHTLEPSKLDENLISSDPDRRTELLDRVGVSISIGRSRQISNRLFLKYSAGLDYYKTKFHFQIVNSSDPSVILQNNRMDLGINLGFDYHHSGILGTGRLGFELGGRTKLVDFSNGEFQGYSRNIATYRVSYLIDVNSWLIGPTYTSFLSSKDLSGYGKINPTIYGFMLRREIKKSK